jgi:hypothetical protein
MVLPLLHTNFRFHQKKYGKGCLVVLKAREYGIVFFLNVMLLDIDCAGG